MKNFKEIHIGNYIKQRALNCDMEIPRLCKSFKCSEEDIYRMFKAKTMDSGVLLQWSKLLNYDFFRLYTQHLILYAPLSRNVSVNKKVADSLPSFKKSIYTKEIIDFIIELINTNEKTINEILNEYKIPKTTLYKWISKYNQHQKN
ncbi:transposase [Chryseobacterium salviniae]|uniref:Transposase n=1 Tax=Chryseobacterium salviniae TaxID=3101750 RepID=A0ABU6HSE0_9FLAO|nr:transposase [Chryseobacterium sp. T9W2-O]MEC3874990.1 transposase [Chryseobacterium sp. T9W2-O]